MRLTWNGHKVYYLETNASGWAKIAFVTDYYHNPWSGTGACYALYEDIIIDQDAPEDDDD